MITLPEPQRAMMRTLKWRPVTAPADDVVLTALAKRGLAECSATGAQREWRMTPDGADWVMGRMGVAA